MRQEKIKTNHFKIINVGFPKTASKSFSKALESLGYKVADLAQAIEYFEKDWRNYIDGKAVLKDLILRYDEEGFEATSDVPFNSELPIALRYPLFPGSTGNFQGGSGWKAPVFPCST